ncbi:MAG: hypothetical protein LUQ69_10640 [Methanoregulaceae archaeon]|nr:hypothetical protein [Methanoregulaceae archaeon]
MKFTHKFPGRRGFFWAKLYKDPPEPVMIADVPQKIVRTPWCELLPERTLACALWGDEIVRPEVEEEAKT